MPPPPKGARVNIFIGGHCLPLTDKRMHQLTRIACGGDAGQPGVATSGDARPLSTGAAGCRRQRSAQRAWGGGDFRQPHGLHCITIHWPPRRAAVNLRIRHQQTEKVNIVQCLRLLICPGEFIQYTIHLTTRHEIDLPLWKFHTKATIQKVQHEHRHNVFRWLVIEACWADPKWAATVVSEFHWPRCNRWCLISHLIIRCHWLCMIFGVGVNFYVCDQSTGIL